MKAAIALMVLAASVGAETLTIDGKSITETSPWRVTVAPDDGGKYQIQGSVFAIGDPVHEYLTLQALKDAQVVRTTASRKDVEMAQYIRGVFWNDDPCAQLLAEDDHQPLKPSLGILWYTDFQKAKKSASDPMAAKPVCGLLGLSHFGELQFLHGMATRNGESPRTTSDLVARWAEIAYRVAVGDLDARRPLKDDPTGAGLPRSLSDYKPIELFRAKTVKVAQARALGSLLHMIQDSYAHGHVTRSVATSDRPSEITQFLSYADQNASKHGHDDGWGEGSNDLERTLNIPGARDALRVCTEIARLYRLKAAWNDVGAYLQGGPLRVSPSALDAGPGNYQ